MHFYPEVNTNGLVSEIWHGAKLCQELDPELLTPMFDAGHGTHYYVNELAQLIDGCLVIPVRWIKVDGKMHADVRSVELNLEVYSVLEFPFYRLSMEYRTKPKSTPISLAGRFLFLNFDVVDRATEVDPIRVPDPASSTGCSCYRLIVNTDPSDNPMQAEICSCMGATANLPCRKCKAGGSQEDKASNEGYHALFSVRTQFTYLTCDCSLIF
jgi:hypothetical protein